MNNDDEYFYRVFSLDTGRWFRGSTSAAGVFNKIGSAKRSARTANVTRFEIWRVYCGKDSVLEAVQRNEDITRFVSTKVFEQLF